MNEESGIAVDSGKIDSGLVAVMESAPVNLKHRVRFYEQEERRDLIKTLQDKAVH